MKQSFILLTFYIHILSPVLSRRVVIGDSCHSSSKCVANANCTEDPDNSTFVCRCNADFVGEPGEKNCLPIPAKVGDQCHLGSSTQCAAVNGTECQPDPTDSDKGICECTSGLFATSRNEACRPGVLLGQTCSENLKCLGSQTVCDSHCICSSHNFIPALNRQNCLEVINELNAECLEHHQCSAGLLGENSKCLLNPDSGKTVCSCDSASITDKKSGKCLLKAVQVGDKCKSHPQCYATIDYSFCNTSGVCRCVTGTVASTNGTQCLNLVAYGDACTDDNQCAIMENLGCVISSENANVRICACKKNHILLDGKCYELAAKVGDKCWHSDQCEIVKNSTCQNGFCLCDKESHVPSENMSACLQNVTGLHKNCDETGQCAVKNSVCRMNTRSGGKTCQCPEYFMKEIESLCVLTDLVPPQPKLNGQCRFSEQCHTGIGGYTECSEDGVCRCTGIAKQLNGKCFLPARLHQICSVDDECRLGSNYYAVCNTNSRVAMCECCKNSVEKENKCWRKLTLGEDCESDIECHSGITGPSECDQSSKKCVCLDPSVSGPANSCTKSHASRKLNYSILLVFFVTFVTLANFVTFQQ